MSTVVNTVVINSDVDRVYHTCTNVTAWPRIFASVREVVQTVAGPDQVIMEMTVSNDLGDNTVRSHRRYDRARNRIEFTMSTLPPALATLDGTWVVEPADGGAQLSIVHNFEPQPGHDETELATTLWRTTKGVMAELKRWVEADGELADLYASMLASTSKVSPTTYEVCELFFSRLGLCGLDWGDISMVAKDLKKDSTHEDWDDWHRRWSALGRDYERRAEQAFDDGRVETGRLAIGRAAASYHFAEFFYFDEPELKNATRAKVTAAFERGLPYRRYATRPLRIPYQDLQLPGYLMTPAGEGPWPCVILINGLDSAKEVELQAFAEAFLARGMAAVVFDGPGQGELCGHTPMVLDFENVVAEVLRTLGELSEVDSERIGMAGVSFGGYLAPRAAASLPQVRACVSLSGGFDHDSYEDLNVMVQKDFKFVFGVDSDEEMAELSRKVAEPARRASADGAAAVDPPGAGQDHPVRGVRAHAGLGRR
jgi:dienelactone hydrolase/ribosome-associated toxin RatA of RatAB toxin-antitoxin module